MDDRLPVWSGVCEDLRPLNVSESATYLQALNDIYYGTSLTFKCYYRSFAKYDSNETRSLATEFLREIQTSATRLTVSDALGLLLAAATWTLVRYATEYFVFLPVAKSTGVFRKNISRFSESAWKASAFLFLWLSAYYVTFYRGYSLYYKPMSVFFEGNDAAKTPWDLSVVYILETSFYVHSVYATLFMDTWRKDSLAMMSHHFVTLGLVIASYSIGFYQTGVLVFLLCDIGDVILESSKVCGFLMDRKSGKSPFFSLVAQLLALLFAIQWFVLRIYCHVTIVWRVSTLGVWYSFPNLPLPFHLPFIIAFGILYILYLYWFAFILLFVKRMIGGKKVDPREEEDAMIEKKPK